MFAGYKYDTVLDLRRPQSPPVPETDKEIVGREAVVGLAVVVVVVGRGVVVVVVGRGVVVVVVGGWVVTAGVVSSVYSSV